MGVKGLWTVYREHFGQCFRPVRFSRKGGITEYEHVLVDVNSILHATAFVTSSPSVHPSSYVSGMYSSDPKGLARAVLDKLDMFMHGPCVPTKSLFLAVDGVAPWAKIAKQRERRKELSVKRAKTTESAHFNRLEFTPGTAFMDLFEELLHDYAEKVLGRLTKLEQIIISGPRVPGEGEEKIMRRLNQLRSLARPNQAGKMFVGNTAILCVDSDMVLQPLLAHDDRYLHKVSVINWRERCSFHPETVPQQVRHAARSLAESGGAGPAAVGLEDIAAAGEDCSFVPRPPSTLAWDMGAAIMTVCGNDTFPGLRVPRPPRFRGEDGDKPELDEDAGNGIINFDSDKKLIGAVVAATLKVLGAPVVLEDGRSEYPRLVDERSGRVNLWVLKRILLHVMGRGHEDAVVSGPSLGGSALRAGPAAIERTVAGLRGDLESRLDVDVFCADVDVKRRPRRPGNDDSVLHFLRSLGWLVGSAVEGQCLSPRWTHGVVMEGGAAGAQGSEMVVSALSVSIKELLAWLERQGDERLKGGMQAAWKAVPGSQSPFWRVGDDTWIMPELCAALLIPASESTLVHPLLRPTQEEFDTFCEALRERYFGNPPAQIALQAKAMEHIDAKTRDIQKQIMAARNPPPICLHTPAATAVTSISEINNSTEEQACDMVLSLTDGRFKALKTASWHRVTPDSNSTRFLWKHVELAFRKQPRPVAGLDHAIASPAVLPSAGRQHDHQQQRVQREQMPRAQQEQIQRVQQDQNHQQRVQQEQIQHPRVQQGQIQHQQPQMQQQAATHPQHNRPPVSADRTEISSAVAMAFKAARDASRFPRDSRHGNDSSNDPGSRPRSSYNPPAAGYAPPPSSKPHLPAPSSTLTQSRHPSPSSSSFLSTLPPPPPSPLSPLRFPYDASNDIDWSTWLPPTPVVHHHRDHRGARADDHHPPDPADRLDAFGDRNAAGGALGTRGRDTEEAGELTTPLASLAGWSSMNLQPLTTPMLAGPTSLSNSLGPTADGVDGVGLVADMDMADDNSSSSSRRVAGSQGEEEGTSLPPAAEYRLGEMTEAAGADADVGMEVAADAGMGDVVAAGVPVNPGTTPRRCERVASPSPSPLTPDPTAEVPPTLTAVLERGFKEARRLAMVRHLRLRQLAGSGMAGGGGVRGRDVGRWRRQRMMEAPAWPVVVRKGGMGIVREGRVRLPAGSGGGGGELRGLAALAVAAEAWEKLRVWERLEAAQRRRVER
ncbi:5'-3' exoribonuclease 1, partial [Phlyctochytrium bullatum]